MSFLTRITATHAPASVILIRLVVGAVFLSEGIQKFLFPLRKLRATEKI
jgi:putative oxidoreductase